CSDSITVDTEPVAFTFTTDRIDEMNDGSLLIIDYKTGSATSMPNIRKFLELTDLSRTALKQTVRSFQLPLYYFFTARIFPAMHLNAALYSIRNSELSFFIPDKETPHAPLIIQRSIDACISILNEIFNTSIPFYPDPDESTCRYCPYQSMCSRHQ
ncbi:MAG: hypothetical protein GF384_03750, partial [Elusimicrobia bacterium]|nr:hypothetical protein [Elusimicrobiota bacterium]MBD3412024.1 hypothetical protein [Elusimicrobiota bacterium]